MHINFIGQRKIPTGKYGGKKFIGNLAPDNSGIDFVKQPII